MWFVTGQNQTFRLCCHTIHSNKLRRHSAHSYRRKSIHSAGRMLLDNFGAWANCTRRAGESWQSSSSNMILLLIVTKSLLTKFLQLLSLWPTKSFALSVTMKNRHQSSMEIILLALVPADRGEAGTETRAGMSRRRAPFGAAQKLNASKIAHNIFAFRTHERTQIFRITEHVPQISSWYHTPSTN